jgi:hypothetical protein
MPNATATAPRARKSPVRRDIAPIQVQPTTEELYAAATAALSALITDADTLASALTALYAMSPWDAATPKMSPEAYAEMLGARAGMLPDVQRQRVVRALAVSVPKLQVKDVAALVGASVPTIARDRKELGLISASKSVSQPSKAGVTRSAATPAATPAAPVTKMVPVLSMTSVREFINALDDTNMLEELGELITERMATLGVEFDI